MMYSEPVLSQSLALSSFLGKSLALFLLESLALSPYLSVGYIFVYTRAHTRNLFRALSISASYSISFLLSLSLSLSFCLCNFISLRLKRDRA